MKFLVIGESCLDQFVDCSITRLSPEGPVPVLNPVKTTENWGMAANVVNNLISLGAPPHSVFGVHPEASITKRRFRDTQTGALVVRVDENDTVDRICLKEISAIQWHDYGAIIVSDYNKGFLREKDIEAIISYAQWAATPVFLDTKKRLGEWSRNADWVKINEKEYLSLVEAGVNVKTSCKNLLVTKGGDGCWWVNEDKTVSVDSVEIADVSGAGDSFLAAFAQSMTEGATVEESMNFANKVARIAVSRRGVVAVNRADVS